MTSDRVTAHISHSNTAQGNRPLIVWHAVARMDYPLSIDLRFIYRWHSSAWYILPLQI